MRGPHLGRSSASPHDSSFERSSFCLRSVAAFGLLGDLGPIGPVGIKQLAAGFVLVVMADPLHIEWQLIFIATLRYEIEEDVCGDERIQSAAEGGVGVKDLAGLWIFVE